MAPEDTLVTIDVQSLYTNIPHTEDIQVLNRILEETTTDSMKKILICRLANLVLTKKTNLSSTKDYIDRHKAQLWEQEWPSHMQIYL